MVASGIMSYSLPQEGSSQTMAIGRGGTLEGQKFADQMGLLQIIGNNHEWVQLLANDKQCWEGISRCCKW